MFFNEEDGALTEPARVEVIGVKEFKIQWEEIIKAAGAMVVDRLNTGGRVDYVLRYVGRFPPTQHERLF